MIHLLMRYGEGIGCTIEAAFAHQQAAHLRAEVENLMPSGEEGWYVTSLQVDHFDNEEGIGLDPGLPCFEGESLFLVVETGNPDLPGVLPVAAFTSHQEATGLAHRQALIGIDHSGQREVQERQVIFTPSPFSA